MNEHTKGKWHYRVDMAGMPEGIFVYGTGEVIISRLEPKVPLLEANARLMVCAPEMLKTLERLLYKRNGIADEFRNEVENIIEKVKG